MICECGLNHCVLLYIVSFSVLFVISIESIGDVYFRMSLKKTHRRHRSFWLAPLFRSLLISLLFSVFLPT